MKLTRKNYNGGYLWVDMSPNGIAGWSSTCICYNSDGKIGQSENNQSRKIVAQTNLELPNVPYIEIVNEDTWIKLDVIAGEILVNYKSKISDNTVLNKISSKALRHLIIEGYKAAREKYAYTEEDLKRCFFASREVVSIVNESTLAKDLKPKYSFNSFLETINQPPSEIEIEVEQVLKAKGNSDTWNEYDYRLATYTKDNKTYLKVKK